MHDDTTETMVGTIVTLLFGGLVASFVLRTGLQPEMASALRAVSPWLATNIKVITWAAALTILITAIAIPPLFLRRPEGLEKMATFGRVVIVVATIPAIGYMFGLGFLAATSIN